MVQGVDAMKIRKQGGFTGFWVRMICHIERETTQSFFFCLTSYFKLIGIK